ncbi:hypothetical protein NDU88_005452 [Pleurodeles waltl]|uniref:Uncharacterized protein n=1 Tax=Pleurodeles waltl TaxID=8319 RepID=A0AAV7TB37_PLEWA|nr:hypothetical protein NDU88_005452 [Pleurodeles waltl]
MSSSSRGLFSGQIGTRDAGSTWYFGTGGPGWGRLWKEVLGWPAGVVPPASGALTGAGSFSAPNNGLVMLWWAVGRLLLPVTLEGWRGSLCGSCLLAWRPAVIAAVCGYTPDLMCWRVPSPVGSDRGTICGAEEAVGVGFSPCLPSSLAAPLQAARCGCAGVATGVGPLVSGCPVVPGRCPECGDI